MGWKKLIIGEKMPDKEDPAYKEKREQAENAGKTFAETLRLNKVAACVQDFATRHTKVFLAVVFGFVLFSVSLNLYRMCTAVQHKRHTESAIERQEKELHFNRHHHQIERTDNGDERINAYSQVINSKQFTNQYETENYRED